MCSVRVWLSRTTSHNNALYGEPLGDLVRRTTAALGLTQARMAKVLGLSPAMLSHLVTGQRVKVANPVALTRMRSLVDLAEQAGGLTADELARRIDEVSVLSVDLSTSQQIAVSPGPELLHAVLHAVASGRELTAAAEALDPVAPGLAEVVRVYGLGSEDRARSHFATLTPHL